MIILIIILTILAAILYRMGGASGYNTLYRDIGCPLCAVITMGLIQGWHWSLILVALTMYGSMTTYWKEKGKEAQWWNWALTGFFYAFSCIFYVATYSHHWGGFYLRLLANTVLITAWSELNGNVVWEECGRGAINNLTLLLLLI